MKKRIAMSVMLSVTMLTGLSLTAFAGPQEKLPLVLPAEQKEEAADESGSTVVSEEPSVLRNTAFTTLEEMQQKMGTRDTSWSVLYLPEVEQSYWNFSADGEWETREMSLNLVSNAYQNLEMFLDNGYLLDYYELKAYAEDYLLRKGEADSYYRILTDCLNNPYLLNKPKAQVTDTTYNGRDYSAVFNPEYYYDTNPDLQVSVGFNPPELLRHFVEKGIMEGRKGNNELDMDMYIAYTDGEIFLRLSGIQAPGPAPCVAKYSYSRANYYGKLLGHYTYDSLFEEQSTPDGTF